MKILDNEVFNTVLFGLCFMVMFSSNLTMVYMQKTIVASIKADTQSYQVDGYTTLGLGYFIFGVSTLIAPNIANSISPRLLFMFCTIFYILNPLSFMVEKLWVTYISIICINISSGLLWVGHGNYMVGISSEGNLPRNIGIFWFIYSLSTAVGNVYGAIVLKGKARLDRDTRYSILTTLSCIAAVSSMMFFFLRPPKGKDVLGEKKETTFNSMKTTWKLFTSKGMLILWGTFIFMGFQQALGQAVLGPSIGFTREFGEVSTQLISISGICYGVGEVLGGLVQTVVSKLFSRFTYWRSGFVAVSYLIQGSFSVLIAFCLPNNSVFNYTNDTSIIPPKYGMPLVLIASLIEGYGDGVLNTQIYTVMKDLQPGQSSHTTASFKFMKNMAVSLYFGLSTQVGLNVQMILIVVAGAISSITYFIVERSLMNRKDIETGNVKTGNKT